MTSPSAEATPETIAYALHCKLCVLNNLPAHALEVVPNESRLIARIHPDWIARMQFLPVPKQHHGLKVELEPWPAQPDVRSMIF